MIRAAAILLAASVLGAARLPLPPTPPAHAPAGAVLHAARSSLPLPPLPPADAQTGEPAPLPDGNLPPSPSVGTETTKFNVRMFSLDEHGGGLAFIPGSAYVPPEDRKPMQTPGITVSLPVR